MPRGGKRKNAGRKTGSLGKVTVLIKASLAETCKAYTAEAVGTLVECMGFWGAPWAARTRAAEAILERGHGKAPQSIEHTGKDGGPIETRELTDLEAARRIAWLLGSAAAEESKPNG